MLQSSKQQTLTQKNGNENNEMNIEHILLPLCTVFYPAREKKLFLIVCFMFSAIFLKSLGFIL